MKKAMFYSLALFLLSGIQAIAEDFDPRFTKGDDGFYAFDTGALQGKFRVDEKEGGLVDLRESATKTQCARLEFPGLLALYRSASADFQYYTRHSPKTARILDNGSLEVKWPSSEKHPVDVSAVFAWTAPDTLDAEFRAIPNKPIADYEIFVASYFTDSFKLWIPLKQGKHVENAGKRFFFHPQLESFCQGHYFAFLKSLADTRFFADGRWGIDFIIHPNLDAAIGIQRNESSDVTVVVMARRDQCYAVQSCYEVPGGHDGVSKRNSVYFSLFGREIVPGETESVQLRCIVKRGLSNEDAIREYERFDKKP